MPRRQQGGGHRMLQVPLALLLLTAAVTANAQTRLVGDLPRKDARALVQLLGLETEYGQVQTSDGFRLRTILTRPAGSTARSPAIFLAQWVSCGSLDVPADRPSMIRYLAENAGMVFVRVDRSGTGDSEGTACSRLDYDTEVRHYR